MHLPMQPVTLIRDGRESSVRLFFSSADEAIGVEDVDIREGDILKLDVFGDRVVSEVNHRKGLDTLCVLVSKSDWRMLQGVNVNQTWNIGSAGAVAGRDMHGVQITMSQFLQKIEQAISEDPTIPESEKKGMLQKIGDLILSPRVVEATVAAIRAITVEGT